jgi:hypothetical protein
MVVSELLDERKPDTCEVDEAVLKLCAPPFGPKGAPGARHVEGAVDPRSCEQAPPDGEEHPQLVVS